MGPFKSMRKLSKDSEMSPEKRKTNRSKEAGDNAYLTA